MELIGHSNPNGRRTHLTLFGKIEAELRSISVIERSQINLGDRTA